MEKRFDRKGAGAPTGPAYWRSLEELTQSEAFLERLHDEFPQHAAFLTSGIARREFLNLAAASLMLGGLNACTRQPKETIVPYVEQPENVVPGKPRFYATAATIGGYAQGILVESHEGRPTKIEGNERHPDALGATTLFSQADLLDLYDPDRSRLVLREGRISTRKAFLDAVGEALAGVKGTRGAGLRILTPTVTSPTLAAQIE
ncbi:MAG: molybdopterin oxidoreductase, partial [Deltaproteobacteria bacterium]